MTKPLSGTDLRAIAGEWERLLQGGEPCATLVRPEISQSWRRSLSYGVAPGGAVSASVLGDQALDALSRRRADLIEVARPIMKRSLEFLPETGCLMALTDADGVVLWVDGDPALAEQARDIGLRPGGAWAESAQGTSGIGTALALGRTLQVRTEEHFVSGIKGWTCSAGVIRDPIDEQILGVLNISAVDGPQNSHCLALAAAEAHRIELSLAKRDADRRTRLLTLAFGDTGRWMDGGVVIFDHRGKPLHANRHAARFLEERGLPAEIWRSTAIRRLASGEGNSAPEWLSPDWLAPVTDRDLALGSVLTLPSAPRRPAAATDALEGIVGNSPALAAAKQRAAQLAKLALPVLLLGPTGAGKEVFAAAIHKASGAKGAFLPINCGAISRDLLASELFGYADGAFTGARRGGMAGKFEAADGGTLFLDEIGEMPLDLQAHLLRVLEDGAVYRVGEVKPRQVKVRVIAATHRDLKAEVAAGRFRMDLYYRLSVAQLLLPALAERREDVAPLVAHFTRTMAAKHGLPEKPLAPGVLEALEAHDWPGNVRELRNVVESMLALSTGPSITQDDLPPDIRPAAPAADEPAGDLRGAEAVALRDAIRAEHGNLTRAATRLGIAKSTLYEKMKRHGLSRAA